VVTERRASTNPIHPSSQHRPLVNLTFFEKQNWTVCKSKETTLFGFRITFAFSPFSQRLGDRFSKVAGMMENFSGWLRKNQRKKQDPLEFGDVLSNLDSLKHSL